MIYIKELNELDKEKEYLVLYHLPENEMGFTNPYHHLSRESFESEVFPKLIRYSKGIGMPEGWVPETYYFLWDDEEIVGLFRLRHFLNESLKRRGGHIGYGILKPYRGQGYGTAGLKLVLEKAWDIIPEDEVWLSCQKNNPASLKVMMKNGAVIHHEDDAEYYTRITNKSRIVNHTE